jgi:hypothetical protein
MQVQGQNTSMLDSIITENKYTFTIEDGEIKGNGLDFLTNEAAHSQFFMVGELHGNKETPAFISALLAPLKQHGYNYLALEIGPYSNQRIAGLMEKGGINEIGRFYSEYGFKEQVPVPFFNMLGEAEMLEKAYKSGFRSWGVDQEFVFSAPFFFEDIHNRILPQKHKSEQASYTENFESAAKRIKELLWSEDRSRYQEIFSDPDISSFLMKSIGHDSGVDKRILALQETWRIYQDNALRRSYRNNNTRIELIKRYFTEQYKEAQKEEKYPKVLVKMGSMHTVYGYTSIGIYDIGNYLRELAIYNGSKSFNIALAGRYYVRDTGERIDRLEFVPEYEELFKYEEEGDHNWTILDLRPLKMALIDGTIKTEDRAFMYLLLRYDAVLLKTLYRATRQTTKLEKQD